MEEIEKGEFISWESEGKISILLKNKAKIVKYTLIPRGKNYLMVWARSKAKWSTLEYYDEKFKLDLSMKGFYSLKKQNKKYILKLDNEEFILPSGLPKERSKLAIKSERPIKSKKFRQMKLNNL